jgi:hypothetical protein
MSARLRPANDDEDDEPTGPHLVGRFGANLAEEMSEDELKRIAADVLEGINADIDSRVDWVEMAVKAVDYLGIEYKEPARELTGTNVSVVESSLILELAIRFWALAEGEFLPADGPVKVKDDEPSAIPSGTDISQDETEAAQDAAEQQGAVPARAVGGVLPAGGVAPPQSPVAAMPGLTGLGAPTTGMAAGIPMAGAMPGGAPPPPSPAPAPGMGHNGGPPMTRADLAGALEKDLNHFLTKVDRQYYRDFSRMLFSLGPMGTEFRKVYRCMRRKHPVSEWVRADNLIVSQEAAHLSTALRVTERLFRSRQEVRRLQRMGWWRDVELTTSNEDPSPLEERIAQSQGTDATPKRPKDQRHEIYECYTDLDLTGFEHPDGDWLPYRVTVDSKSRQILEIRRNWREGDADCRPRQRYVMFGLVPGLKFYALGLIHMGINQQRALTAMLRILIDSGMFSSFPGFLKAKSAGRVGTTDLRVKPGQVKEIDIAGMSDIQKAIMAVPFHEPSASLMEMWKGLGEETRRALGGLEQQVGEGRADIPVGTMIAQIEQGTKVMAAVHKGLHQSRCEEFELLMELFREDPSALWKFAKTPKRKWEQVEEFSDLELSPSSDPNVPSQLHRIMLAQASLQMAAPVPLGTPPGLYNLKRLHEDARRTIGLPIDDGIWAPPPAAGPPPPPDPKIVAAGIKAQSDQQESQRKAATELAKEQNQQQTEALRSADAAADRQSKENIAALNAQSEHERLQAEAGKHLTGLASDLHQHHTQLAEDQRQHTVDTLTGLAQPAPQPSDGGQ